MGLPTGTNIVFRKKELTASGRIAWSAGRRAGIAFDMPLDPDIGAASCPDAEARRRNRSISGPASAAQIGRGADARRKALGTAAAVAQKVAPDLASGAQLLAHALQPCHQFGKRDQAVEADAEVAVGTPAQR